MNRAIFRLIAATSFAVAVSPVIVRAESMGGNQTPAATPAAPAAVPSDNQLNDTGSSMQNTNNNAAAAVSPGGAVGNAANSASTATKDTGDKLKATADAAGAGTPTADNPAPDAKDIRKTLGKVATEAMEKGDLDDLVSLLAPADRVRIKKSDSYDQSYGEKLDGRIDALQQAWTTRYGHAFELKHANKLFGADFAVIQQGQVGKDSDVETVVKALGGDDDDLQPGRGIAVVAVMASRDLPALKVPLVHELPDSWKIDVPDDVDASKLRKNLLDHFTALGEHTADWPAEENEAYRAFTHHVLMAVLGKAAQWQGTSAGEPTDNTAADTGGMGK